MKPSFVQAPLLWAVLALAGTAAAQPSPTAQPSPAAFEARQRFESEVRACNNSGLPDPAREACVRRAGVALDNRLNGTPGDVPVATPDGRAIVMSPAGSLPRPAEAEPVTSRDGRATIVRPTDGTAPR
ncbi:MAG: hypothetical protein KKC79_01025 [Gammaproteobacteria bacterium]|nr:hypothetical protein [Gammaproteobacteria bacterium]MBU1443213.1 hypothetical protein [Gammaproteobacteria bacterium]MBU2288289.1 hypothetical protein [Gammaproteobacteria bacterium]MBU2407213.1 hypothetical protein [Gammaproteobacteria bacterium]